MPLLSLVAGHIALSIRVSQKFTHYLINHLEEFYHMYYFDAFLDKDELVRFWGQRVKGQGHEQNRYTQKLWPFCHHRTHVDDICLNWIGYVMGGYGETEVWRSKVKDMTVPYMVKKGRVIHIRDFLSSSLWFLFNPLECSGIRWLYLKLFNAIQV